MTLPTKEELLAQLLPDPKPDCTVCWEEMNDSTTTPCKHSFHFHCITSWLERSDTCPLCRTQLYRKALDPFYFRDFPEPLTANDFGRYLYGLRDWASHHNITLRNHRHNVLHHINHFRTVQQSASTGLERAFIGLDQDILDRLAAAYRWSRPNPVNGVNDSGRCLREWRLVMTAFLEVIGQLRGISVTSATLTELLLKKVDLALKGNHPRYCQALEGRPEATTFKDDVESCIALFVKMAQQAYDNGVATDG